MEGKQPQKRNAGYKALIVLLLIIITVSSCIGMYAWAKYISTQEGTATAQIAKWNFNVSLKAGDTTVTLGEGPIDLATTQYNHVADGKIAPGTSGEFQIIVDTTGTEVSMTYDVSLSLADCPRNITFSRKGAGAADTTVISAGGADNADTLERTISFRKYVAVNPDNENGIFTETIYWDWPYEADASATAAEKTAYDARDNEDEGKTVTMNIVVTGTAVLEDPALGDLIEQEGGDPSAANSVQSLAKSGAIQRWDIIEYDPGTLTTASIDLPEGASIQGSRLASLSLPSGATLNGTINASEATEWVVLDVNEATGEVKIMPRTYSSTTLTLSGMDGYNNAIEALDSVASIYLNSKYAKSARSIRIEDVNKVEGHTPNGTVATHSWNHRYSMDSNLNIVDNGEENKNVERTYTTTAETGADIYSQSNFEGPFWVASRCVNLDVRNCAFIVRYVSSSVIGSILFNVNIDRLRGYEQP